MHGRTLSPRITGLPDSESLLVTTSHLESFERKSRNRLSDLNEINSTNLIIRDQNSETEILEN